MQPLDLHVEHRLRVHLEAERALDVLREPLLVALLHRRPLLQELRIVEVLEQALYRPAFRWRLPSRMRKQAYLELVEVLEEHGLLQAERLADEVAETGVALVEPPTRGD